MAFLTEVEEVVATLYAPQDLPAQVEAVRNVTQATLSFRSELDQAKLLQPAPSPEQDPVDALQKKVSDITIDETDEAKEQRLAREKIQKWFDTCFSRISRLSQTILSELDAPVAQ